MWSTSIVDEPTDIEGRHVANFVIDILETDGPGATMLLNSKGLDNRNYSTISKLFEKSLMAIRYTTWIMYVYIHECGLLFSSDAAPWWKQQVHFRHFILK